MLRHPSSNSKDRNPITKFSLETENALKNTLARESLNAAKRVIKVFVTIFMESTQLSFRVHKRQKNFFLFSKEEDIERKIGSLLLCSIFLAAAQKEEEEKSHG